MLNQNDNISPAGEFSFNISHIQQFTRVLITLTGLGITLFGIKYTLDIFLLIYGYLQKPDTLTLIIEQWSILLNIKGFMINDYPLGKLLAIVILAIGALLMLRITLGFIQAGTSMLISSVSSGNSVNSGGNSVANLDYKLNKLKNLADQGVISKQAYEQARDKYLVQKIIEG